MIHPGMKCLGYYWIFPKCRPEWCSLPADSILSIDDCFSRKFPDLSGCFWTNYPDKTRQAYREYLRLDRAEFSEFSALTEQLFNCGLLSEYSCFRDIESAVLMGKFLRNIKGYRLVGIFTEYPISPGTEILNDDMSHSIPTEFLGCEILGSFAGNGTSLSLCSYLSNSLNDILAKETAYMTDRATGLILNSYEETKKFARQIQGMGEPVVWTPFEIYEYYPEGK